MKSIINLIGKDVNFLTTDPDNAQAEGQIWYNSPAGAFKDLLTLNAWSNGGSLSTEHRDTSAAGTQTAGLCFSGSPPSGGITATEEYNGSGWGTGGALNTARRGAARFSASTQTAGLVFGGSGPPNPTVLNATEEYNGTAWTSVNNLPAVKYIHFGAGIQTAALSAGGYSGTAALATTEEYDGTNWSAGNAMGTARYSGGSAGTQTAGLIFGGTPPVTSATEEYDGTNWTAGGSMNNARKYLAGCGIQTSALAFGAGPTAVVKTEKYDGTSWTETADMGIAQKAHGGAGSQSAALSCGGESPSNTGLVTQEFNNSTIVTTGAAWASAPNMNTARGLLASAGTTQNSQLGAGGYSPPAPSSNTWGIVEEYNGTSWSEVTDLPSIKSRFRGVGTQTAAATFGGFTPLGPNTNYSSTEKYDGTNWTTSGNMNTARCYMAGFGTQTAAVCVGGATLNPDVVFNKTEEYNGSSWTSVNNMPNYFRNQGGAGIITAGVVTGGKEGPNGAYPAVVNTTTTLEYDGTNWTSGGTSLISDGSVTGGGTQSVAWFAGYPVPSGNISTHYNGTSFVTSANCAESHSAGGGGAPQTSGIIFADGGEYNNKTEEFNPETTTLNIKTITTG